MTPTKTVTCTECGSAVVVDGLGSDRVILCARCYAPLTLGGEPASRPHTRKATLSLLLGLASLVGVIFTGIPAIVVGILALRDIDRRGRSDKGRSAAITGIVTGALFGFACGPCLLGTTLQTVQMMRAPSRFYSNPAEIIALAEQMGIPRVPEGLEPLQGDDTPAMNQRTVVFVDQLQNFNVILVVTQLPASMESTAKLSLEQWTNTWADAQKFLFTVKTTSSEQYTLAGRQFEVSEERGHDQSGRPLRKYVALVPHGEDILGLLIITGEEPPADLTGEMPIDGSGSLSPDEIREFLESIE